LAGRVVLATENLKKHFGGVKAVDGVSIQIREGEFVGLIGPNGSGKSTLFNVISGIYKPTEGKIYYRGKRIDGLKPHEIFRMGLVRGFQVPRLWRGLTVVENLMVPPKHQRGENPLVALVRRLWTPQERKLGMKALSILSDHELLHVSLNWADSISGGQMKLTDISRALMGEPSMLLLDEPTAGVAPRLARDIFRTLERLRREQGITLFVIEHRLEVLFDHVDRVIVMHQGKVLTEGTPEEVASDPRVVEAYLGEPVA